MNQIGTSLTDTLKKSDLSVISRDISEIGIDILLEDGVFKDIPIINSLYGLYKTGKGIRDYLFFKKVLTFLSGLSDVPIEERKKFLVNLENDPNFKQKVGEYLIILLDKLDDLNKPIWLANAFKAFCNAEIDSIQFQCLGYAIDKVLFCEISYLEAFFKTKQDTKEIYENYDEIASQNFLNAGLACSDRRLAWIGMAQPNETCELFLKFVVQKET